MRKWLTTVVLLAALVGCESTPSADNDRHAKLLSLAAGEAGQIANASDRLKRQLNFADRQLDDGRTDEGRQTLAAAAETLRSTKPADLPPRIRLAGWVSISELSRRAKDTAAADAACEQAVATLRSLDPVPERAEYAVGVATEVRELHGKPAAAKLLVESAAWAARIAKTEDRREALLEIADATFDCDDYPGGLATLRTDPDAAWRSDTLAMLAGSGSRTVDWASSVGNGSVPGTIVGGVDAKEMLPIRKKFGRTVDYRSVFGSATTQP
jgi:hypothetical protein